MTTVISIVLWTLFVAFALAALTTPIIPIFLKWIKHRSYAREARKHNERARQRRLKQTEWNGYPLPTGKQGVLYITRDMIYNNPYPVSDERLKKAYFDRGRDLGVEVNIEWDPFLNIYIVRWRPDKSRKQKERY